MSVSVRWLEWLVSGTLFVTTAVSYVHSAYTTALVCGVCAGFTLGLAFARWFLDPFR